MKTKTTLLKKQKSHAFGKDVYLLGVNEYDEPIWLEAARWDCDWYWGFGYIEVYTIKWHPSSSKDISSHEHWNGYVGLKDEKTGKYIHHLNESPRIQQTVLSDAESWKLADLMATFYTLKKTAEICKQGNSHICSMTGLEETIKNEQGRLLINEQQLPAIFESVYRILTP